MAAREEVKGLKSQIDTLEGREVSCPTNEPTTASTGTSCISQDGSQNRVFDHGTFILKAQNTVCYCDVSIYNWRSSEQNDPLPLSLE